MDIKTLSIAVALVGTSIALAIALFSSFRRERGLFIYAGGFMSAAVGFSLLVGHGMLPFGISYVAANMLIVFYHFCIVWGFRSFFAIGAEWPARFWAYLGSWFAALLALSYLRDSFPLRTAGASALIIVAGVELVHAMRLAGGAIPPIVSKASRWTVVAFIACHAARVVIALAGSGGRTPLIENDALNAFTFSFTLAFLVLWAGIVLIVDVSHLVGQLQAKNAELEGMASSDELTGLHNRHALDARLEAELERAARYGVPLSVVMFDVDHFKRVNDTLGHAAGDEVLRRMARIARDQVRRPDDLFRWGGEEFLLLAPHTDLQGATALAEKLRAAIEAERFSDAGTVTASFGVAEWRAGEYRDEWFRRVDQAMYRAKNAGRNRVVAFGPDESLPSASVRLCWKAEWESGNRLVDDQHRGLVDHANNLLDLSLSGADAPRLLEAVDELVSRAAAHFADEEALLESLGYPEAEAHAGMHRTLEGEAAALRAAVASGDRDFNALFDFVVRKLVLEHLAREDALFFGYTRGRAS